jgi:signal transduction histidine kinase
VDRDPESPERRVLDVLVVDDHQPCASAVTAGLASERDLRVTCTPASLPDLLSVAARLRPDVVLLDATVRGGDALEATRRLRAAVPGAEVIVMTLHESPAHERRALEAGARALLGKPRLGAELDRVLAEIRQEREEETARMNSDFGAEEVTRDLSARKRLDAGELERLERLQRLELSAVLAAGLAHDLATPIATMKLSLSGVGQALQELEEILHAGGASPRITAAVTRGRNAVASADEASDYMHRLTRDFVRFARGGPRGSGRGSVRAATETAVRYTRTHLANRASLAVRVPRELDVAVAERTLVRVLVNLILNAGDAFTGDDASRNWIVITAERIGDAIQLEVTDNAGGIPPEARRHLFVPLAGSHKAGGSGGLGLGLAVARALLRDAGGDLTLVATGPSETRFRCTVPAA